MAIIPANSDYTDRDFESIRLRLYEILASVFPAWTNTDVSNFGNILVELFAFTGDVLTYYQDNQARESRISTVQLRKNAIALCKLIGYEPPGATASQADVVFSIAGGNPVGAITIPAETVVKTSRISSPVQYRTIDIGEIDYPASNTITITVENSEPRQDLFDSSNTSFQHFHLTSIPYIDGSVQIGATNGSYTEVETLLTSHPTDRHYTVEVDEHDRALITFGDGITGAIPTGTIVAFYRTGGGSIGNVDAGTIDSIEGSFTDEFGNPVTLAVINPAASSPAVDRATVEEIRFDAPLDLRRNTRTVTRLDYEDGAYQVPGVVRALMLTSDDTVGIPENTGYLFIVATGGTVPTQALLDSVKEEVTVNRPNTLTFRLNVVSAVFKTVDVTTVVHLEHGVHPVDVKAGIIAALEDYFNPTMDTTKRQVTFGFYFALSMGTNDPALPWSDIHDTIVDVPGVRKIDDRHDGLMLNQDNEDVELLKSEFPRLGSVVVINAATLQPI